MRRLAWLVLCVSTVTYAETTQRFTVLFSGRPSGEQRTTISDDGTRRVFFTYRANGRGPDIDETTRVRADGTITSYRVKGKSTYGAPIDESFDLKGGTATWRSPADRGSKAVAGAAVYQPIESSFDIVGVTARALLQSPTRTLPGLPAGQLAIEKLTDVTVTKDGATRVVSLYSVTGLDTEPAFVWLDAKDQRLFATIFVGLFQIIESGWEPQASVLERAQDTAEQQMLRALKAKLTHVLPSPIVIRNVQVFDAKAAKLLGPRDVYVDRGKIGAIYPPNSQAQGARTTIDGSGKTLLPALLDLHVHEYPWSSVLQIAGGVTTVRDMGSGSNDVLFDLIDNIDSGRLVGARILPAGYIEGDSEFSSMGTFVVKSLDEAKVAVDWYTQRGFRQLKLYNSFKPEWVAPIAAYAHERGLRVGGHIPAFMTAEQAVRAGYDEIQHINQVMLNFFVGPKDDTRTLARFYLIAENAHRLDLDSQRVQDFIALLKERNTTIDVTLATFEAMFLQPQGELNPTFAPIAAHMPSSQQRAWRSNSMNITPANAARYRASYAKLLDMTRRLHAAGIRIVAGTDELAGFTLHRELELYVQAGIPAAEALQIATWVGAQAVGTQDWLGSIEPHKSADLILVDGDPVADISNIRRISMVMKAGEVFFPAEVYEAVGVKRFVDPPSIASVAP